MQGHGKGIWVKVSYELPPEGVVVDTKIDNGNGERMHCKLLRDGSLWFRPDGLTYVYYVPTHWLRV